MKTPISIILVVLTLFGIRPVLAKTPLKVYILAGQSNMQGQANPRTIDAMRGDPEVADLYKDMTDKDGKPVTVEGVHIVYGERSGKLDATFGAPGRGTKMGPEYAFGIYMNKTVKEPILLIKTAWGGKDLIQQFRPPSAGAFEKETDKHGNATGHFYRLMINEVKDVLADPGKFHPAYDKDAGYEIAGFVWFQGYNDMINTAYYRVDRKDKNSAVDYSEYTRLMGLFIRDVRKDLSAPNMKVVIGTIGISGDKDENQVKLAKAQGATADMPEFKDNVGVVYTAKSWDHKLAVAADKMKWVNKKMGFRYRDGVKKGSPKAQEIRARYIKQKGVTAEEVELTKGVSNGAYHYLGSAKIYSRIGKAFADAMFELERK